MRWPRWLLRAPLAVSVTVMIACNLLWFGMAAPPVPRAAPHRPLSPVRYVQDVAPGSAGVSSALALRSPTMFALPGGAGFSSFLTRQRDDGLSPVMEPEYLEVILPPPSPDTTPSALPDRSNRPSVESRLAGLPPPPPLPPVALPARPAPGLRVLPPVPMDWVLPDESALVEASGLADWQALVDLEFDGTRVVGIFLAEPSRIPETVLPALRQYLALIRLQQPAPGPFTLPRLELSFRPTVPGETP